MIKKNSYTRKEDCMHIQDMIQEIERFIDQYEGTAIGESIHRKLENTDKTDVDRIVDIYDEIP